MIKMLNFYALQDPWYYRPDTNTSKLAYSVYCSEKVRRIYSPNFNTSCSHVECTIGKMLVIMLFTCSESSRRMVTTLHPGQHNQNLWYVCRYDLQPNEIWFGRHFCLKHLIIEVGENPTTLLNSWHGLGRTVPLPPGNYKKVQYLYRWALIRTSRL